MAIGDRAYRSTVPPEAMQLADEKGLGEPNWFIPGTDAAPDFPDSVRSIFEQSDAISARATPEEPQPI
jgi:hypothetical protein